MFTGFFSSLNLSRGGFAVIDLLPRRIRDLAVACGSAGMRVHNTECSEPVRDEEGFYVFEDKLHFRPNLSPKEIFQAGAFGGTYFRPIKSSIVNKRLTKAWEEFPSDWFEGLSVARQVASSVYRVEVNKYRAKTGQSLETWESKGWIVPQDPYGWGQWYCRFFLGRRTEDDERQIGRWKSIAGEKVRMVAEGIRSSDTSVFASFSADG